MPTVVVTGANRGLGLEFAKQYQDEGGRLSPPAATQAKPLRFARLTYRYISST